MASPRTLGIDLASQAKDTAACLIEWTERGGAVLPSTSEALTDDVLLGQIADERVVSIGIDAPFGWPHRFIEAATSYREDMNWPPEADASIRFRETEIRIRERTGRDPLSSVSGWLFWPTLRCARLLSQHHELDTSVRTGDGRLVEVYPAAALFVWGLSPADWIEDPGSYKGPGPDRLARRERLVEMLVDGLDGRLDLGPDPNRFVDSDDELDALICALIARAAERGQLEPIPSESTAVARAEGWIRLPAERAKLASL